MKYFSFFIVLLLLTGCNNGPNNPSIQRVCEDVSSQIASARLVEGQLEYIGIENFSELNKFSSFNPLLEKYGPGKDVLCYFQGQDGLRLDLYLRELTSIKVDQFENLKFPYVSSDYVLLQIDQYEFPRDRKDKRIWCFEGC